MWGVSQKITCFPCVWPGGKCSQPRPISLLFLSPSSLALNSFLLSLTIAPASPASSNTCVSPPSYSWGHSYQDRPPHPVSLGGCLCMALPAFDSQTCLAQGPDHSEACAHGVHVNLHTCGMGLPQKSVATREDGQGPKVHRACLVTRNSADREEGGLAWDPGSRSGLGLGPAPAASGAQFRSFGFCPLESQRQWCVCCFLSSPNILHLQKFNKTVVSISSNTQSVLTGLCPT